MLALKIKCRGCGKELPLGDKSCKACGFNGVFTPGPCRKPVTPYNQRKESFVPKGASVKPAEDKMDLRKLQGTLLAAAASDVTRMALPPSMRAEWGDIELKTEIGEGAYAIVYEGLWKGNLVAVKELKFEEASDDQMQDFLTEVSVLAGLKHPNVIDFVGACAHPKHLAILLEFMPTGDASILLARDDVQITWQRRLSWLLDVARAVQYLHANKITHRDIKSDNVLISADFQTAKITDFGLSQAKAASFLQTFDPTDRGQPPPILRVSVDVEAGTPPSRASTTPKSLNRSALTIEANSATTEMPRKPGSETKKTHHQKQRSVDLGESSHQKLRTERLNMRHFSMEAGTPAYVAPEIWRMEPYSDRVDAYSFAIVMWEFMTRDWAFDGLEVQDIIERVRDEHERPDVPSWCPRSFNTLMTDCWADSPLFRPPFDVVVRRLEALILESMEWPPAPNEWPEYTRTQTEGEDEVEEEVIEEVVVEEEEEVVVEEEEKDTKPKERGSGKGGAGTDTPLAPRARPVPKPKSPRQRTSRSSDEEGRKVALVMSVEDLEKGGIESMLENFIEQFGDELATVSGQDVAVEVRDGVLSVSPHPNSPAVLRAGRAASPLVAVPSSGALSPVLSPHPSSPSPLVRRGGGLAPSPVVASPLSSPVLVAARPAAELAVEGATVQSLPAALLAQIVAQVGLVEAVRAAGVCKSWRSALGERPDLWRWMAMPHGFTATSLKEFCSGLWVRNALASQHVAAITPLAPGRFRATLAQLSASAPVVQARYAAVPFLGASLGVSFFEFAVVAREGPVARFDVGWAAAGATSVLAGVSSEGSIFLDESHPSSFPPVWDGSRRGIGLEWETKQMFVTHGKRLLYFQKISDVWSDVRVALYPTIAFARSIPDQLDVQISFSDFDFDLQSFFVQRQPEVQAYIRLLKRMNLS